MHNLDSALSDANEKMALLEKIWPSKTVKTDFKPENILCFVDANPHSRDALSIALKLSQEFDCPFSIRSLFDQELLKLADPELLSLKQSIIEIVKETLDKKDLSQGITFLEGDAIESIEQQLSTEYDLFILPIPYHSNLSDHPEAVAIGSLGEYLIRHSERPLFFIPELNEIKEDLFESIIIIANDISDIIQNENYLNSICRNRSKLYFIFIYSAKDIETLAEASKGVLEADIVKKRVRSQMELYGEQTIKRFNEKIEVVEYYVYSEKFVENIINLAKEKDASLLTILLPGEQESHQTLFYNEFVRSKMNQLPMMILRNPVNTVSTDLENESEPEKNENQDQDIDSQETDTGKEGRSSENVESNMPISEIKIDSTKVENSNQEENKI